MNNDQDIFEAFDYYEDDDKDFLFEMSNLRQDETGLSMIVWADVNRIGKHNSPRIKVSTSDSSNVGDGELIPVLMSENPRILAKNKLGKLSPEKLRDVGRFIALNKDVLLKYWNGELSSREFTNSIKHL